MTISSRMVGQSIGDVDDKRAMSEAGNGCIEAGSEERCFTAFRIFRSRYPFVYGRPGFSFRDDDPFILRFEAALRRIASVIVFTSFILMDFRDTTV